jgi:hypothetical protein
MRPAELQSLEDGQPTRGVGCLNCSAFLAGQPFLQADVRAL